MKTGRRQVISVNIMRIVYLDQNQWVKLARARKYPSEYAELRELGGDIERAVLNGKLCLPLTAANIYETYKINRPERRKDLALVQSTLSQGIVIVGRHKRLASEISSVVRAIYGLPFEDREERWFLSNFFFEAFAELCDDRVRLRLSKNLLESMRADPPSFLFDYLVNSSDEKRRSAVSQWSAGSEELRQRIEHRRQRFQNEPMAMRRRAYSALLMIDELEVILKFADDAGAPWQTVSDIGSSNARRLIREVPAYHVERELTLRIEAQNRSTNENDLRDMATFCATIPYADCVISENLFVNLAIQAGLDRQFGTTVTTDLMGVARFL